MITSKTIQYAAFVHSFFLFYFEKQISVSLWNKINHNKTCLWIGWCIKLDLYQEKRRACCPRSERWTAASPRPSTARCGPWTACCPTCRAQTPPPPGPWTSAGARRRWPGTSSTGRPEVERDSKESMKRGGDSQQSAEVHAGKKKVNDCFCDGCGDKRGHGFCKTPEESRGELREKLVYKMNGFVSSHPDVPQQQNIFSINSLLVLKLVWALPKQV